MISYQRISYHHSTICIVENRYSIEELLKELDNPSMYESDLEKLKSPHRKTEFLAIRIALKKAFNGEEKSIEYTYDGKPVLKDGTHKISFSHCSSSVAVMMHPSKEVGIDVEAPSSKLVRIHERFLGKEELEEYKKTESLDYLRVAWSVKEALYKIIGDTAYNFAEQLKILPFPLEKVGTVTAIHVDTGKIYEVNFLLTDSFTLAYCVDNE